MCFIIVRVAIDQMMNTSRIFCIPRRINSLKNTNLTYITFREVHPELKTNLLFRFSFKNQKYRSLFSLSLFDTLSIFKKEVNYNFNSENHNKNVYLVKNNLKYHQSISRKNLSQSLQQTIKSIKGRNTKVVYIVGLPGTGKKELTKQYAKDHYMAKGGKDAESNFVAIINASNPENFHQDIVMLAEKLGISYNFNEVERNGYYETLCKITSHLQKIPDWLFILNDIKLDTELKWLIGERSIKQHRYQNTYMLDLSNPLPSPGDPSKGTILVTTCDSSAYAHQANNTTSFNMPKGMEDDEALELLKFGSGISTLHKSKSALKVVNALGNVPTSVYW